MKALRFALVAIAVLLLVVVAAGLWVTSTQSGTGWLLGTVSDRFVPALSIGETNGSLAQELEVRNLVYAPPGSDTRIEVDAATVDLGLLDLLGGTVRIESAAIEGVDAVLGESSEPQQQEAQQQGSPLEPPIDIVVDEFTLQDAVVRNAGAEEPLVEVEDARFAGSWTSSGIAVEQLSLDAEQGNVRLTGRASTGDTLAVDAEGRFEWQVGDSRYAGQLEVGTSEGTTEAVVNLNAPFNASLTASADLDPLEWQVDLEIPEFDPRDALLPAGQFESIAASLSGSGTDDTARIEGRLTLDGEPIVIETLEVRQQPEATVIESLVLSLGEGSSGTLRASGSLATGADPLVADLDVRWQDL
ncbi:MAG TPA: hypothetical protein VLT59_04965, partial [Steroidobacteraceae bacterium]|nr:hypothetical protein [Steroidobacteraceae bacterium]